LFVSNGENYCGYVDAHGVIQGTAVGPANVPVASGFCGSPNVQPTTDIQATAPAAPVMTAGESNAVGKAEDYLGYTAFSRTGLIKQLEFDQFSVADATYAVGHISVNWDDQAAAKAKDYLGYTSFSHGGLVTQLEFDGFTAAQSQYGVTAAGL
jgi:hypothetical protein